MTADLLSIEGMGRTFITVSNVMSINPSDPRLRDEKNPGFGALSLSCY